jgi:hypothetical protein
VFITNSSIVIYTGELEYLVSVANTFFSMP